MQVINPRFGLFGACFAGALLIAGGCGGAGGGNDLGTNNGYGGANPAVTSPDATTRGTAAKASAGEILFSYQDGGATVFAKEPLSGGHPKTVTKLEKGVHGYASAADGKVAFGYAPKGSSALAIYYGTSLNPAKSKALTDAAYKEIGAIQMTADGKTVFFTATTMDGKSGLYKAGEATKASFVDAAEDLALDSSGAKVAYTKSDGGVREIYTMNADGSGRIAVTKDGKIDKSSPAWSPDGAKIAFLGKAGAGPADVYLVDAKGGEPTNLTKGAGAATAAAFSPAGDEIVYASTSAKKGQSGIYRIKADGTSPSQVYATTKVVGGLSWSAPSPLGKKDSGSGKAAARHHEGLAGAVGTTK